MAVDSYVIRPCRPEDVPVIVALEADWLAEDITIGMVPVDADTVRSWLGPYCWVAERNGETIGFAYATLDRSEGLAVIPVGEPYLRVEELYVRPEHRNAGVGNRLVDRLLAAAAARGVTRGRVYSSSRDWRRIVDFYERRGFRMWIDDHTRPALDQAGQDGAATVEAQFALLSCRIGQQGSNGGSGRWNTGNLDAVD